MIQAASHTRGGLFLYNKRAMKYFILSIDDGTVYDKKVIPILNRHGIKGTFNLNTGLEDFVWYKDGRPVERLHIEENKGLYEGHEVASHSLTHPHLTQCCNDHIGYEVGVDMENLGRIFQRQIKSFAFPFEDFDERSINRIKAIGGLTAIRVSEINRSFRFPIDPFHIKITSLNIKEALELFPSFLKDKDAELFVFVSHAYDFEFDETYDELEKLCEMVERTKGVKSIFTHELPAIMGYQG